MCKRKSNKTFTMKLQERSCSSYTASHSLNIGINWIWSELGEWPSRTSFTQVHTTVQTATQTITWCPAPPKRFHCSKKSGNPPNDASKMSQPDLVQQFERLSSASMTLTFRTIICPQPSLLNGKLGDVIHKTALPTFGKKTLNSKYWFEAKSAVMTPAIKAKRATFAESKRSPNKRTFQILTSARMKAQRCARHRANEYWTELSQAI